MDTNEQKTYYRKCWSASTMCTKFKDWPNDSVKRSERWRNWNEIIVRKGNKTIRPTKFFFIFFLRFFIVVFFTLCLFGFVLFLWVVVLSSSHPFPFKPKWNLNGNHMKCILVHSFSFLFFKAFIFGSIQRKYILLKQKKRENEKRFYH